MNDTILLLGKDYIEVDAPGVINNGEECSITLTVKDSYGRTAAIYDGRFLRLEIFDNDANQIGDAYLLQLVDGAITVNEVIVAWIDPPALPLLVKATMQETMGDVRGINADYYPEGSDQASASDLTITPLEYLDGSGDDLDYDTQEYTIQGPAGAMIDIVAGSYEYRTHTSDPPAWPLSRSGSCVPLPDTLITLDETGQWSGTVTFNAPARSTEDPNEVYIQKTVTFAYGDDWRTASVIKRPTYVIPH